YDDAGRIPVLPSVAAVEHELAADPSPRVYLPMEGLAAYRSAVQRVVFGADSAAVAEGRVATIQTLGGTGALKVGADLLQGAYPESEVWISDPAWDNHHAIFGGAGFKTRSYPYYDPDTKGLAFDAMMSCLRARSCCCIPAATTPRVSTPAPSSGAKSLRCCSSAASFPFLTWRIRAWGRVWKKTRMRCAPWPMPGSASWWPIPSRRTSRCTASAVAACRWSAVRHPRPNWCWASSRRWSGASIPAHPGTAGISWRAY